MKWLDFEIASKRIELKSNGLILKSRRKELKSNGLILKSLRKELN